MFSRKNLKVLVCAMIIAGIIHTSLTAYAAVYTRNIKVSKTEEVKSNHKEVAITVNTAQAQKAVDTSKVSVSKEIENLILSSDKKNGNKHLNSYKMLLAELEIPVEYQNSIESMYKKGYKAQDVLIAYEYLYQNYGTVEDFESILSKKGKANDWKKTLKEFKKNKKEYVPSNFAQGKLEELMKIPGITPDDIMIADRIAQQNGVSFDKLIQNRKVGLDWGTICADYGILNTSQKLPRVAVTEEKLKKYMKSTKLNENQILRAIVTASKLGVDETQVIEMVKSGYDEETIYANCYEAKYN